MTGIRPDKAHDERPGAVLEKPTTLKKWLFGIAVVSLFGVSGLLLHSGRENRTQPAVRTHKTRPTNSSGVLKDTLNGHEWVDLGLPSGVKWATCNVGAGSPTECGEYYAWGETEPKEDYIDITSLTHRKDAEWLREERIIGEDGNLTKEHDAATLHWGEPWRMPTDLEYEELLEECRFEFTACNGVNGYLATGPNGESIFLVAAGFKQGTEAEYLGDYGDYWSATVVPELTGASCSLGYGPTSIGRRRYTRFAGRTIRPVTD